MGDIDGRGLCRHLNRAEIAQLKGVMVRAL